MNISESRSEDGKEAVREHVNLREWICELWPLKVRFFVNRAASHSGDGEVKHGSPVKILLPQLHLKGIIAAFLNYTVPYGDSKTR